MSFQNGYQLHDGVDADPHRVKIEHLGVFLGVHLVQTLLEHLGLLEVGLLAGVLAPRKEDLYLRGTLPAWMSSSKMEEMRLVSTCCSCPAFLDRGRYIVIFIQLFAVYITLVPQPTPLPAYFRHAR